MYKQTIFRHGHELSNKDGKIRKSRFVLYEKLDGVAGKCNWCDIELTWKTLCADHLDSNIMNDIPENLVGSCRGCNANREDGTGHGRIKPKECLYCKKMFIGSSHHKTRIFCSNSCSSFSTAKRETKALHGTRSRYMYGCRCLDCKKANSSYWRTWSKC